MRPGLKNLLVVALIGAAAFLLWWIHPAENKAIPQCLLLQTTGLHCPGCGSLRSIHFLLQGNLAAAWAMNPLTILLLPGLVFLGIAELLFRRHDIATRIPPVWLWLLAAVFILFGILRNLPAFACLAPH
ncbi:hypothetical protein PDESU_00248 [Pontiella desulfatans]|uniref:DUF2752 domain-containing protein n=1 Tax=Pontiella desulfatans TaxID=2750659 RepID=A0A6C2TVY3_PONDE|nr:DUF2752 domain-containing protein [Pontiella desulfatans]VGO11702.1 hypothetical protein PDESU_00248 [Pontiella desulfatans]